VSVAVKANADPPATTIPAAARKLILRISFLQ